MYSIMQSHAACTLFAPLALTAHTATYASPCALHLPGLVLPSPSYPPQGVRFPTSPSRPVPLKCLTPPCLAAAPADPPRGEGKYALPPPQTFPGPPDGPHLKPAASPVPRPLGGASVLTLATARAPGGFTCWGGAPAVKQKFERGLGLRAAESGAGARRARTGLRARWLLATPGRAEGGRAAPRAQDLGGLWRRRRGRGKSPPSSLEPVASALSLSSGAARLPRARGCPSSPRPSRPPARGSGERRWPGAPARAAGPRVEAK